MELIGHYSNSEALQKDHAANPKAEVFGFTLVLFFKKYPHPEVFPGADVLILKDDDQWKLYRTPQGRVRNNRLKVLLNQATPEKDTMANWNKAYEARIRADELQRHLDEDMS